MKYSLKRQIPAVTCITGALLAGFCIVNQSSQAATFPGLTFACDTGLDSQPINTSNTLYGMYRNGASVDLAQFRSAGGYDEATRCQMISWKLNQANLNNQLSFIKVGDQNGEKIACAVQEPDDYCDTATQGQYTYLFTIAYPYDANPEVELNRFFTRLISSRNVGHILQDSDSQEFYIDFEAYVQSAFSGIADVSTGEALDNTLMSTPVE